MIAAAAPRGATRLETCHSGFVFQTRDVVWSCEPLGDPCRVHTQRADQKYPAVTQHILLTQSADTTRGPAHYPQASPT